MKETKLKKEFKQRDVQRARNLVNKDFTGKTQTGSGYSKKIGFEGGQMPLQRRVPKFGFKNINRVEYKAINLDIIENLASVKGIVEITPEVLKANGLLSNNDLVKVLGRGELKSKVSISANGFSTTAIAAIEAQGGTCNKI